MQNFALSSTKEYLEKEKEYYNLCKDDIEKEKKSILENVLTNSMMRMLHMKNNFIERYLS